MSQGRRLGPDGEIRIAPARAAVATAAAATIDPFLVGLSLKRAQHELRLAINAELEALGTNISQVNVLREIKRNPGVSSSQLATLAFLTPQSLGQLVVQLQRRGLVERQPGRGRKLRHYLTDSGDSLCREAITKAGEVDANVLDGFSDDELASLVETFRTIEERARMLRAKSKRFVIIDPH